jgi:hypothetical protein
MAVVAIEGFDLYNGTGSPTGLQAKWAPLNWFFFPSLATGRFGGQAYAWSNEPSFSGLAMPSANASFTVAAAFRCTNVPSLTALGARSVLALSSGGGFNFQLGWRPNNDGSISVYRMTSSTAGTLLGTTAPGILLSNVWHFVEFSGLISTTVGTIALKVDGTTVLTLAGQNTQGFVTTASFDGIVIGSAGISGGSTLFFDDIYVLDTAVSLGERRVETIRPNGDTAQKDFTPDTGTVNFSRVNDTLVNSATYVQSSTLNNSDLYNTLDMNGTPVTIDFVQITAFAQKTDAGARSIKLIADVGGTQLLSGDLALTGSLVKYAFGMAAKPGGGAWAAADVNALKIGPKVSV